MELGNLVCSRRTGLVAAELAPDGRAELFFRENGTVTSSFADFPAFMLIADPGDLDGFTGTFSVKRLNGDAVLNHLLEFADSKTYYDAVDFLKSEGKKRKLSPRNAFSDPVNQLLNRGELRLYHGMEFEDVRRLAFDIETLTAPGFEFPNSARAEDEIIIISLADNHGFEITLSQQEFKNEKGLLEAFIRIVTKRDPDILLGHNIFRFDLPYLEARAKRCKVKLELGRNGTPGKKRNSFFAAAERTVNYTRYDFYGRMVVDTYHLAQFYDVIHRSLESLNLKYLAKHFGVAAAGRTYVDGAEISQVWHDDPARLLAYALDDAREAMAIAKILLPSYFFMAQLVPLKLQDCVVRGRATIIDHMLVSAYLKNEESLPLPEASHPFAGALTVSPKTGVFRDVHHVDVRSLYPSIILAESWTPCRDTLGEFTRLLTALRDFRLKAKDAANANPDRRDYFAALQSTFKILINSFYGYLGSAQGSFNDFEMAERITARGREILQSMLDFLAAERCTVLEADTDGVYFQLPSPNDAPGEWLDRIQAILPPGIQIEMDAHYPAMFCYKSKNYALLSADGELEISGAALKSRGLEPFQRDFMEVLLRGLLKGDFTTLIKLYRELRCGISGGTLPVAQVAKTETLKDSIATYLRKIEQGTGRRSAAYALAAADSRDYQAGDQVTYYVTGTKKNVSVVENSKLLSAAPEVADYNRDYYMKKLDELYEKFAEFIPEGVRTEMADSHPGGLF